MWRGGLGGAYLFPPLSSGGASIASPCSVSTSRSSVGSRAGAPTVGSGGHSTAFAMGLSPAPVVTFPTPATSNPACRLPAPGFPADFLSRVMGPIVPEWLSARGRQPDTQKRVRVLCIATAYSTASSQISLRLEIYSPSQVLHLDGRVCHSARASLFVGEWSTAGRLRSTGITPLLRYYAPLRHPLTFSPLPGVSGYRAYLALAISRQGEEGFSSCSACPCHRAIATTPPKWGSRLVQHSAAHAAFALRLWARPSDLRTFGATAAFTLVTAQ